MANDFLKQFIPFIKATSFGIGENIFEEGAPSDGFLYFILNGNITVSKRTPQGDDEVIRWLGPGDFFGELALIQSFPRSATVTAVSETVKLGKIDKDIFNKIAKASPQFISHLLKSVIFKLAEVEAKITHKKEEYMNLMGEMDDKGVEIDDDAPEMEESSSEAEANDAQVKSKEGLKDEPRLSPQDIEALQKMGNFEDT